MDELVIAVTVHIDEEAIVAAGLTRDAIVEPTLVGFLSHRRRVAFDVVGFAIGYIDATAIGTPAIVLVSTRMTGSASEGAAASSATC